MLEIFKSSKAFVPIIFFKWKSILPDPSLLVDRVSRWLNQIKSGLVVEKYMVKYNMLSIDGLWYFDGSLLNIKNFRIINALSFEVTFNACGCLVDLA